MQRALLNYMTHNRNLRKPQLHFSNVALHFIFQNFPTCAEPRTSISRVGGDPLRGSPPTRLMLVLGSALHIENQRKQNLTLMNSVFNEALDKFYTEYLYDILIFFTTPSEYLHFIEWVIRKLWKYSFYQTNMNWGSQNCNTLVISL